MKKSIIAFVMLMFLYSCSTVNSQNKEYRMLKTRIDSLATQIKTNSINIQNNTLRLNSVEMKIMQIQKRLAKQREQDSFANKIPPISAIIDGNDNKSSNKQNIKLTVEKVKKPKKISMNVVEEVNDSDSSIYNDAKKDRKNSLDDNKTSSEQLNNVDSKDMNIGYKQYYKKALSEYMSGNYEKAKVMFEAFIKEYKKNDLTDNAIFWLAHSYLHLGKKQKAVQEFKVLIRDYPYGSVLKGGKTDEALYDLIRIYSNDKIKADYYKKILLSRFPVSRFAKIARK